MHSALLVIDVQESFTRRPYFSPENLPTYLAAQNALIAGAQALKMPIVRVFHRHSVDDAADCFAPASGLVRPLEGLAEFDAALTVNKTRHSALVGTGLDVWLVAQGIQRLIVSGIRTEQCCETTTRHASDLGWQVHFVAEATLTWDMALPDGTPFSAADIRSRTAAVLQGRFAEVLTVEQALQHARGEVHVKTH
jgi:nicotinamidase-related amidase